MIYRNIIPCENRGIKGIKRRSLHSPDQLAVDEKLNLVGDGIADDSSRWCAASANDYPASVIIDLEKNYNISKIKVVTHKPGARAYKFIIIVLSSRPLS